MRDWRQALAAMGVAVMIAAPGVVRAQGAPAMPGGPFTGQAGNNPGPKTVALQKKAEKLQAQYRQKPNPKLKMQTAQALYEYGHARMYDSALSPRQRYRPALQAFREALKLNPNLKQAKADKDQIESVYRSMGMPIPQ